MNKRRRHIASVGELLGPALRDLGMPSARLTKRVLVAWAQAADPAWRDDATPLRLDGGVLVVGVRSSALRQELTQFHRTRLLHVLKTALPDVPLVGLHFGVYDQTPPVGGSVPGDDR